MTPLKRDCVPKSFTHRHTVEGIHFCPLGNTYTLFFGFAKVMGQEQACGENLLKKKANAEESRRDGKRQRDKERQKQRQEDPVTDLILRLSNT